MYFFVALLIVSLPAWWLAAAISYFFEFYYLAAGLTLVGCASPLVVLNAAGPKFGRRQKHQDISPETDNSGAESTEFDAINT
jgi:hypothetical protein